MGTGGANGEHGMTRADRWLAAIAMTGVGATVAGLRLVWMLLTAPVSVAVPSSLPHEVVAAGQWVWQLAQRLLEWL